MKSYLIFEIEDLAAAVLGLDDSADDDDIEDGIASEFGIDMEQFEKIAVALAQFTVPAQSALMGTLFRGFVKDGAFLLKVPVAAKDKAA